jgi:hypothetical protein
MALRQIGILTLAKNDDTDHSTSSESNFMSIIKKAKRSPFISVLPTVTTQN